VRLGGLGSDVLPGHVGQASLSLTSTFCALGAVGARIDSMAGTKSIEMDGWVADAARLERVCRRFGVAELAVFGSVARGDTTPDSDIDLLYKPAPGARLGFDLFDFRRRPRGPVRTKGRPRVKNRGSPAYPRSRPGGVGCCLCSVIVCSKRR